MRFLHFLPAAAWRVPHKSGKRSWGQFSSYTASAPEGRQWDPDRLKSPETIPLTGNTSWTCTPVVLSCMLLSALAAERSVPGKCPQGPLESPGLEEVGLRPVRRSGLGDKPSCLLQRRWEHVNKSLIRAIVFIPFSSQLNGLLPSHGAVYLERDKEKEWNGWGYKRF